MRAFFCSDLHGRLDRYQALLARIEAERPELVLLGGDLLPHRCERLRALHGGGRDFLADFLVPQFLRLADRMGDDYPQLLVILGNDDARLYEAAVLEAAQRGIWTYIHMRRVTVGNVVVYGYAHVPPTPFLAKDWERYDVSRYVDPGAVPPEEGWRTVPVSNQEVRFTTIQRELAELAGADDLSNSIWLFHAPPYQTALDRAALDGRHVEHAPLDLHVGSVAIRRFIEERQPLLTLHGHIHESVRLTGTWHERLGRTHLFGGAHDGRGLALVRFDTEDLESATREIVYADE